MSAATLPSFYSRISCYILKSDPPSLLDNCCRLLFHILWSTYRIMPKLTSKGNAAIWLGVIVFVLDFLAVLLRLLARRSKRVSLGADDYLIILAIPLEFTYIALLLWGKWVPIKPGIIPLTSSLSGVVGGGGGLSIFEITVPELTLLFKVQLQTLAIGKLRIADNLRCNTLQIFSSILFALLSKSQSFAFIAASSTCRNDSREQAKLSGICV